jgi:hypothetical protein
MRKGVKGGIRAAMRMMGESGDWRAEITSRRGMTIIMLRGVARLWASRGVSQKAARPAKMPAQTVLPL